jgi:phage terminase large subunit-like protein
VIVGRRGGKSLVLATIATYLATLVDWRPHLADGERGTIMCIAADRRQARTIYRYIRAMLRQPLLTPLVQRETEDLIELSNSVSAEIAVASYKSVRG